MSRQNYLEIIKESVSSRKEWIVFGSVKLIVKDHPPRNVNIQDIIQELEEKIPRSFVENLDVIYIGDFDHLNKRGAEATYQNGAIHISNNQPVEEEFVESIIHEIAHCVEEKFTDEIYSDGEIREEFLGKRRRLWALLKSRGFVNDRSLPHFMNLEYSKEFDMFLYKKIGYKTLGAHTMGLFLSPYAATSLREYFANAFEHFFLNNEREYVKQISPHVYNKLNDLL